MRSVLPPPLEIAHRCNIPGFPGLVWLVNHALLAVIPWPSRCLLDAPPADPDPAAALDPDDDAAVLRRAAGGDEQSWQQLFDRWKKPLLGYFYRSLGSMPDAEDLTLEVFVRLNRSAAGYEPRAQFSTFIFHIARNLLLNEIRRRRRKPAQPVPPEAFDYVAAPDHDNSRRLAELEEVFQQALAQLPEAQRTVLLLIHQQGLDQSEAAAALGITENALRVQLHRARQQLKELMSSRP
ncbi:MAG: RNA polymerase sigma factor [Opitutus sp.]